MDDEGGGEGILLRFVERGGDDVRVPPCVTTYGLGAETHEFVFIFLV